MIVIEKDYFKKVEPKQDLQHLTFGGMENIEDIEQVPNQEDLQMQMIEAEQFQRELEENSQRMIQLQQKEAVNDEQGDKAASLKPVKNPISPYMMFVMGWKSKHPEEKFNMSALGTIWREMGLAEKQPYETEYKQKRKEYDEYQAALQLINPNVVSKEATKYLFPLQRIRSIMKQDSNYNPKTEAFTTMSKATQYFADYMLEQVKRMSEGKNRIDYRLLYDCINNVRSFQFLECLIEEHNRQESQTKPKKTQPEVRLEMEIVDDSFKKQNKPKQIKSGVKKADPKRASAGQTSLDYFVVKQR